MPSLQVNYIMDIGKERSQMLNISIIFAAIATTAVATAFDLKTKQIPDWTSYALLIICIFGNTLLSVSKMSFWPIALSLLCASIYFGAGYLLYKAGAWGGGDVKLAAALGALFGPMEQISIWPTPFSFWLNALLFGAIFGIIGMLVLLFKNRKAILPKLKQKKILAIFLLLLVTFISLSIFSVLIKQLILLSFVSLLGLFLFLFKSFEKECLYKKIRPSSLVEGDWVVDEINIDGICYQPKKIGVEASDIENLKKLEKEGKLLEVNVKDGIPYVPAMFAALLLTLARIDLIYAFLSVLWL